MRCGGGDGVEDLAAGGRPADEVVPGSFPEQTNSGRAQLAAIEGWTAGARTGWGIETCTTLLGPPLFVSLGKDSSLARLMGCALFRRLTYRAAGYHQTREGNTD